MTDPHAYFRDATATLSPDVEALVSGGLERGRARHRRRTTLATVAAGAAVAAVAVAAVSVPQLIDAGSTPIAPAGPGHGEKSVAVDDGAKEGRTDGSTQPRALTVRPADVPRVFSSIVGGSVAGEQTWPSDHGGVSGNFRWNGAFTTVIIDRVVSGRAALDECRFVAANASVPSTCEEQPDGSASFGWQERQPLEDGGVTGRGYTLFTADGWSVDVISYNAATPKAYEYTSLEPPLSFDLLERAATSDAWFE